MPDPTDEEKILFWMRRAKEAEYALGAVLRAVQRYLPPDGTTAKEAMSEVIACVDPWPLETPQ